MPVKKKIAEQINKINLNLSSSSNFFNTSAGTTNAINNMNNSISNFNISNNANLQSIIKPRNTHVDEIDLFKPIGILDPLGIENNPLTNAPYENMYYDPSKNISNDNKTYKQYADSWSNYPMYNKREESIKAIYNNQVLLVVSGTGSGKTVLTPKFALHTLNYQGRIAITNPKRTPTKSNAEWAARNMDIKIGTHIGMKYRGSDSSTYSSVDSKLIYVTDGWILQKLNQDPMLLDIDIVIIDEAHERGIQIDLLLLLLKDLLRRRPEFKLIIMSATINSELFINYFPENEFKFKMINAGESPNHPIKEIFLNKPINIFDDRGNLVGDDYIEESVDKVITLLREHEIGDILIFFPSKNDTIKGCTILHQKMEKLNKILDKKIYCSALTSTTDKETEKLLTSPTKYKESGQYTRKVIFATEVAESSMTFDGLDFVIDTGLVNKDVFYADKNMKSLEKKYISKASHKQRKGRTGRTGPGTCYCLFSENEYNNFQEYTTAPILVKDISAELLGFLANDNLISHINFPIKYGGSNNSNMIGGSNNVNTARELSKFLATFIEIPPVESIKAIINRLIAIDIIDVKDNIGKITDMGRASAAFGLIPEIGRMLISSYNYHCKNDIINLAAIYELTDYKVDSIFEKFRPSSKNESIKKSEKKIYDNVKSKWVNQMGDQFSIIHIYNEFCKHNYDKVDRRTGAIIANKLGDTKEWCKSNFFHFRTLERVREGARHIDQRFSKVMHIFHDRYPNASQDYIFIDAPPVISEKFSDNILRAILDGFYINLLKKIDNSRYINCFPPKKTIGMPDRDSLFLQIKSPTKYAFYTQLISIFGNAKYQIISKVPPGIIDEMIVSKKGDFVKDCFKTMDEEKQGHGQQGQQYHGQQHHGQQGQQHHGQHGKKEKAHKHQKKAKY